MEHVIRLADDGYIPLGYMVETSAAPSRIDPPVPVEPTLASLHTLYEHRMSLIQA
jgi:hypothetical protein